MTQYDNATVGSGSVVDEVKHAYQDWGNVSGIEQDRNSAVGAGGSVDDYEVRFTYEKAADGRNTVRRTHQKRYWDSTEKHSAQYTYTTGVGGTSGGTEMNWNLSRVLGVKAASTPIANYTYNGAGMVIRTILPEPVAFSTLDAAGSHEDCMLTAPHPACRTSAAEA